MVSRDVKFDEVGSSEVQVSEGDENNAKDVANIDTKDETYIDKVNEDEPLPTTPIQDEPAQQDVENELSIHEDQNETLRTPPLDDNDQGDIGTFGSTDPLQALRRSTRFRRSPGQCWKQSALLSNALPPDPTSYKKAISSSDVEHWQKAM